MKANAGFQGSRRILVLVDDYVPFGQSGSTSGLTTAGTQIGNVRRGLLLGRMAMKPSGARASTLSPPHSRHSPRRPRYEESKFLSHWGRVSCFPSDHAQLPAYGQRHGRLLRHGGDARD